MKASVESFTGSFIEVIRVRSPVIFPLSMVERVALSSLSAKSQSAFILSSSPLLRSAPDQANMVATELVDVSSPLRCL